MNAGVRMAVVVGIADMATGFAANHGHRERREKDERKNAFHLNLLVNRPICSCPQRTERLPLHLLAIDANVMPVTNRLDFWEGKIYRDVEMGWRCDSSSFARMTLDA